MEELRLKPLLPEYDNSSVDKIVMVRFILTETIVAFSQDLMPQLGMDFNVFDWSRAEQVGIFLGMFVKLGMISSNDKLQKLFEFTVEISHNYGDNPYHSFNHAVDVAYMVFYLLEDMGIAEQADLNMADKAVMLFSALGHDVLHPGTNNLFQVNSKSPVALKYNNISVLEKQSADYIEDLLKKSTLLQDLSFEHENTEEESNRNANRIIQMIIKTDMLYHFPTLEQLIDIAEYQSQSSSPGMLSNSSSYGGGTPLVNLSLIQSPIGMPQQNNQRSSISPSKASSSLSPRQSRIATSSTIPINVAMNNLIIAHNTSKSAVGVLKKQSTVNLEKLNFSSTDSLTSVSTLNRIMYKNEEFAKEVIMQAVLHAADISNPVKPFENCKRWANLVQQEFLAQGSLEKSLNLPISPSMDITNFDQAQIQLSFSQMIVQPLFECFVELFPRTLTIIDLIVDNTRQWGGTENMIVTRGRKPTEERTKKKSSVFSSTSSGKRGSEGSRRLSLAAGTIEIPDSIQKYFSRSKARTSFRSQASSSDFFMPPNDQDVVDGIVEEMEEMEESDE